MGFLPGAEILPVDKDSDEETEEMDVEQKVEQDGEWVDVAHDPEADLDEDDIKTRMELDEQREQKIDRAVDWRAQVDHVQLLSLLATLHHANTTRCDNGLA